MKRTLKTLCVVLVFAIVTAMFSGCDLINKLAPSRTVTAETTAPNVVINAQSAIDDGLHSPKTMFSFYDENNIWYYMLYIGQIEDFIFQVHSNFQYSKAISDPEIEERNLTVNRVKETYQRIITNSTQTVITNEMSASLNSSVGIKYGVLSAGIESKISEKYKNVWTGSLVEVNDTYLEKETTQANEKIEKYRIKGEYLEEGKWYCYATVATIDVYAAVAYDPSKNAITNCKYYTDILSYGGKKLFSSAKNDFMRSNGNFEFDFSGIVGEFEKPSEGVEIYDDVTEKYVHSSQSVKVAFSRRVTISVPMTKYEEVVAKGYSKLTVRYSFRYQKGKPVVLTKAAMMHLKIGPTTSAYWTGNEAAEIDTGSEGSYDKTFTRNLKTNELQNYKTIYFHFDNDNAVNEYYINNFFVEITYVY